MILKLSDKISFERRLIADILTVLLLLFLFIQFSTAKTQIYNCGKTASPSTTPQVKICNFDIPSDGLYEIQAWGAGDEYRLSPDTYGGLDEDSGLENGNSASYNSGAVYFTEGTLIQGLADGYDSQSSIAVTVFELSEEPTYRDYDQNSLVYSESERTNNLNGAPSTVSITWSPSSNGSYYIDMGISTSGFYADWQASAEAEGLISGNQMIRSEVDEDAGSSGATLEKPINLTVDDTISLQGSASSFRFNGNIYQYSTTSIFLDVYDATVKEGIKTEILSPDTDKWINNDFTVEVNDTAGLYDSCSYRLNSSFGWSSWSSRSCPDGSVNIDLDSMSLCNNNGYDECTVQVNLTSSGSYALDEGKFDIFNTSKSCESSATACWLFEEGEGQAVFDYSGNGLHAVRGLNKSVYSNEPTWESGSNCYSGSCIDFDDYSGQEVNGTVETVMNDENFTISAWLKNEQEGSADWILQKDGQFAFGLDADGNLIGTVNSPACGGKCGDERFSSSPGFYSGYNWFTTSYKPPIGTWRNVEMSWNGTHASFYENDNLIVSKTSSKISGYSPLNLENSRYYIGWSNERKNHANFTVDNIKVLNYSTYPRLGCSGSEGRYVNIGENAEKTGRLKADKEFCMDDGSGTPHWYDQDFGDVDGDGVQDTCKVGNGVGWVPASTVSDPVTAPAFTEGVDDDWTDHMANLESRGSYSSNTSRPDASSWTADESPVPTGVPNNDSIATKGFCAGDDEGEHIITQECRTNLCSTNSSVFAVADKPEKCVLSPTVDGFSGSERRIYSSGSKVDISIDSNTNSIACYGGKWIASWPVSAYQDSYESTVGSSKKITFEIINPEPTPTEFELSIQGDLARFTKFSNQNDKQLRVLPQSSETVELTFSSVKSVSSKSISLQAVSADKSLSGEKEVYLTVNSADKGQQTSILSVPGIKMLQILVLFAVSSLIYFKPT